MSKAPILPTPASKPKSASVVFSSCGIGCTVHCCNPSVNTLTHRANTHAHTHAHAHAHAHTHTIIHTQKKERNCNSLMTPMHNITLWQGLPDSQKKDVQQHNNNHRVATCNRHKRWWVAARSICLNQYVIRGENIPTSCSCIDQITS